MVLPAVMTDTIVFAIPFLVVTDDMERIGIISVYLFRTPVARAPSVNVTAVSLAAESPERIHSRDPDMSVPSILARYVRCDSSNGALIVNLG